MIKEKLGIHKRYLVISSPVSFTLLANNGTDKVVRPSGVWQLDCYMLLPEKFMKNYPVFNLELEYDETKIESGFNVEYFFTDLNLGDSLKGVSGDLIELSSAQFEALKNAINQEKSFRLNTEQLNQIGDFIGRNLVRSLDGTQFSTLMNYLQQWKGDIVNSNHSNNTRTLDNNQYSELMRVVSGPKTLDGDQFYALTELLETYLPSAGTVLGRLEERFYKVLPPLRYFENVLLSPNKTIGKYLKPGFYRFELKKYMVSNGEKVLIETKSMVYVTDKLICLKEYVFDGNELEIDIDVYSVGNNQGLSSSVSSHIDLDIDELTFSNFEYRLSLYVIEA